MRLRRGLAGARSAAAPGGVVRQGGWALVDQVLSSGTNFGVAILVARFLGPADYGSFSFAYTGWIALMGINRSLLVQPFQITAASLVGEERKGAIRSAAGSVIVLGGVAGVVVAGISFVVGWDDPTGRTLLALAFFLVPLVLQDFWRFVAFSERDARAAAANDGVWALVQIGAFLFLAQGDHVTSPSAIVAWAAGAAAGAAFGAYQFRAWPRMGREARVWLRGVISLGGWFTLSNVIYTIGVQASLIIVGVVGGRSAIGGLRSIVNLFGPAQLVRDASENVVLPQAARAHASGGKAAVGKTVLVYAGVVSVLMGLYGLVLIVFGSTVLRLVFGEEFTRFVPLVVPVAVATILSASAAGAGVGLRATRAGRQLASVQGVLVAARVIITLVLVGPYGVVGAAWGQAAVMGISSAVMWHRFARIKETPGTEQEGEAAVLAPDPALTSDAQHDAPVGDPIADRERR